MQRGYLILIIGGALLASGITISVIWAGSLGSRVIQQNTILNGVSIYPSGTASAITQVNDVSRPLYVGDYYRAESGKSFSKRNGQKPKWRCNLNQSIHKSILDYNQTRCYRKVFSHYR